MQRSARFFSTRVAANFEALGHQKAIRRNAQGRVVAKSAPASSLIVTQSQSQILLQILVIALDAPAHVRGAYQIDQCVCLWQRGQIVFFWLSLICWPLDEQSLLGQKACLAHVALGALYPRCCKAARQPFIGAFAPADGLPCAGRQTLRQGFDVHRLALGSAPGHHGRAAHAANPSSTAAACADVPSP